MGVSYQAVGWNRQKRLYDCALWAGLTLYLALFVVVGFLRFPASTLETNLIRAFGSAALLLLHVVLCIGPLCRLNPRYLPLLYNRRHLGVTMCLCALAHGAFALVQYHAGGNLSPLVSLFSANAGWTRAAQFPFELLGFIALSILLVMAATSHDFWLKNLSAPVWKRLHMLVYWAYLLVLAHVALGTLQGEAQPILQGGLVFGALLVGGLHLTAARRGQILDRSLDRQSPGPVYVCRASEIPEQRAKICTLAGERVAIFRYDGKISALSNVCKHQNGPLGEGRVIDGCVTCPWHGYQYLPDTGASPPPFHESVPTFRVELRGDEVWLDPLPLPPGTRVEPARLMRSTHA